MKLYGFQSLTLLDYPGHLAATVFTGGCNFRCPFCHNGDLIEPQDPIPTEEILLSLAKRRSMLDGVCITGGEPTLHRDLPELIHKIRDLGLAIKLDTNGTSPEMLRQLAADGLLDYVAMDIKNSPEQYASTAGLLHVDMDAIRESVRFLMEGSLPYEFRTTLIPELHTPDDMHAIGRWIRGVPRYYLQAYRESPFVLAPVYTEPGRDWMETMRREILPYVPSTELRGLD